MAKQVIAYVSDIVLGSTGEVIRRETQKEAIRRHAEENGYEVVACFEDDVYAEDVITRPGIQRLLAFDEPYDCLLVERVWCFSRSWSPLEPFFKEIQRRGHKIESAVCLWDCVSQRARHYFREGRRTPAAALQPAPVACAAPQRARVSEPPRLHFVPLRRRLAST
jgi:hypothetical protein